MIIVEKCCAAEPDIIDTLNRRMSENPDRWTIFQGLDTLTDYPNPKKATRETFPEL